MTDLETMKAVFDKIKVGYTESKRDYPFEYIELFLHHSDFSFIFSMDGKYLYEEICYD